MNAFIRSTVCLAVGLIAVRSASGGSQIAENSPFLPPASAAASSRPNSVSPFELRGIMTAPDGIKYCIYDAVAGTGAWLKVNEAGHSVVVTSADPSRGEVTLRTSTGFKVSLVLFKARVSTSGTVTAPQQAAPSIPAQSAPTTPPAEEMGPEEAANLAANKAMQEKVARARYLRVQAIRAGTLPPDTPLP